MYFYDTIITDSGLHIPVPIEKEIFSRIDPEHWTILSIALGIGEYHNTFYTDKEYSFAIALKHGIFLGVHDVTKVSETVKNQLDVHCLLRFLTVLDADSVLLMHNHPNQALFPSPQDYADFKNKKTQLSFYGDIELLDSYVLTREGVYSIGDDEPYLFDDIEQYENQLAQAVLQEQLPEETRLFDPIFYNGGKSQ